VIATAKLWKIAPWVRALVCLTVALLFAHQHLPPLPAEASEITSITKASANTVDFPETPPARRRMPAALSHHHNEQNCGEGGNTSTPGLESAHVASVSRAVRADNCVMLTRAGPLPAVSVPVWVLHCVRLL
jgi:hypothetical protein